MSHEARVAREVIDAHARIIEDRFPVEETISVPVDQRIKELLVDLRFLAEEEGFEWRTLDAASRKTFEALKGLEMLSPPERSEMGGAALGVVRLPLEIQRAAGMIIDASRTQKSYKAAVASQYAEALLRDPRATASAEAVRVQLMYLKGNLGWWKGPEAVEAKKAMERIIKRQVPLE